jgi:hypothetical protein
MNLKHQLIENMKNLTNKTYKEINMILKDKDFKIKIFGNINISLINRKISFIEEILPRYNNINLFVKQINKKVHSCRTCGYYNDLPINTIMHMAKHKDEDLKPIPFSFYNDKNHNLKSTISEKNIKNKIDFMYNMKLKLVKNIDIKTIKKYPIHEYIDYEVDNNDLKKIGRINKQKEVNVEKIIKDYKDDRKKYFNIFYKNFPDMKQDFDPIPSYYP